MQVVPLLCSEHYIKCLSINEAISPFYPLVLSLVYRLLQPSLSLECSALMSFISSGFLKSSVRHHPRSFSPATLLLLWWSWTIEVSSPMHGQSGWLSLSFNNLDVSQLIILSFNNLDVSQLIILGIKPIGASILKGGKAPWWALNRLPRSKSPLLIQSRLTNHSNIPWLKYRPSRFLDHFLT